MEIKKIKGKTNRYQYNLIVLISTLNFMNLKLKQYTQTNILYFFNGNLTRNKQQTVKIKTLQNYLYELEKKFKITLNYCKHLGKQCGSEIYYKLKYPKKACHTKINQYFQNVKKEKIDKFTKRIETYIQENGSPKWECINNINNNKKIEERIIKKYISKCHFKIDLPLVLLNSKIEKDLKIELIKEIKRHEKAIEALSLDEINLLKGKLIEGTPNCVKGFLEETGYLKNTEGKIGKQEIKLQKLKEILDLKRKELESQNYKEDVLSQEMNKIYERYKNKPHFIIEQDKYKDLDLLIQKIKRNTERCKSKTKERDDIKNNIFSILLEQLRHKLDIGILIPALKKFINTQDELKYSKVVDNTYYYELLDTIK